MKVNKKILIFGDWKYLKYPVTNLERIKGDVK